MGHFDDSFMASDCKFSDRQVWANSVDPDETEMRLRSSLIRVCTVCHSVYIGWTHYTTVKTLYSNFRVITVNCSGVRIYRIFMVHHFQTLTTVPRIHVWMVGPVPTVSMHLHASVSLDILDLLAISVSAVIIIITTIDVVISYEIYELILRRVS